MPFVPTDNPYAAPAPELPPAASPKTPRARLIVEVAIFIVLLVVLGILIYVKFLAP